MLEVDNRLGTCPMCGSKRMAFEKVGNSDKLYSLYAKCCDCGLSGYKSFLNSKPIYEAKNELIKYWNHRVPMTVSKEGFNTHNTVIGKR